MGYNNSVAIISNSETTIQAIKEMLVLLRDVDKIESCDFYDTDVLLTRTAPSVLIIHAENNDKNAIKLIKKLRRGAKTKHLPVILYPEYENTDFAIEAFEAGVTDILNPPMQDYELVIRVIWAIQKGEFSILEETRNVFLKKLGILDEKTGFFKEAYSMKYLETIIEQAKENQLKSCLMLVKANSAIGDTINSEALVESLKKSVRTNDTIAMKDENTYYVFLSGAKIDGIYSVYERMMSQMGAMTILKASATEVNTASFDDILSVLNYSVEKTTEEDGIRIVDKQDYIDMFEQERSQKPDARELEIAEHLNNQPSKNKIQEKESDKVDIGIKIMQEKVKETQENEAKLKKQKPLHKKETLQNLSQSEKEKEALRELDKIAEIDPKINPENKEEEKPPISQADERVLGLYEQSYRKKLEFVVEPLLNRYAAKLQSEIEFLDANINVSPKDTFMYIGKDDIELNFKMAYDGLKTIKFNLSISALGSVIESDSLEIEVMEFDHQKLDIILQALCDEYKNYLSSN